MHKIHIQNNFNKIYKLQWYLFSTECLWEFTECNMTEAACLSSAIVEKYFQICWWLAPSAHTHSSKHTAPLFPASDSTQPRLFLFHGLIAPTEDHWFYGKPCLQAECHRPEVTFCLLQLEQYWSTLISALAELWTRYLQYTVNNVIHG